MSTHYTRPDAGAARAPFPIVSRDVTRYRSAAEICAAINAAAADAPEFSDACFAPGALDWHGPTRGASFAHFLYSIDGARGSYSVSNTRENLLTLARKVNTIRAAFDGKPRRAPAARKAPTSAPHVAARGLWADRQYREAIQLAENHGAVFFGAAGADKNGVPYMQCETVEFFGQLFTIGRAIQTGRIIVLHTSTGLSVSGSAHRQGLKTHGAALDWIETESACDAWREKFATALHGRSAFDQTAARARYFEDETAPVETAPVDSPEPAAVDPVAVDRMAAALLARFGVSDPAACAHLASFPAEFERIKREAAADLKPAPRAPRDGDRFYLREWKPGALTSWRSAEPSDAPRDYLVRQAVIAGHCGGAIRWAECAETGAFLYGLSSTGRPIDSAPAYVPAAAPIEQAPADAPRADAAPVEAEAAADPAPVESPPMGFPTEWIDPRAFTESDWPVDADPPVPPADPVETAPTPGYAFSADALPATHSETVDVSPLARILASISAIDAEIAKPGPWDRGRLACMDMYRSMHPAAWCAAWAQINAKPRADADPVPVNSDPVPVNSAAPADPDDQKPGETVETWFDRIRRESAEKRARIDALAETVAAGSGSIGFTHPRDPARFGIAGPDMSGRGAFRFTHFDAAGPIGDAIRPTLADAIAAGVEYGLTVDAAPLSWPENPAPETAPVPADTAPPVNVVAYVNSMCGVDLYDYLADYGRERWGASRKQLVNGVLEDIARTGEALFWQRMSTEPDPDDGSDTTPTRQPDDDETIPAPLDGLDVIETTDADALAEFDRLSRAPGVSQPASDARPIPSGPVLRIPAGDLRSRIPARFAPAYLLTA